MTKHDNTGIKYDTSKPKWELLPYDALTEVVKVMTYGAIKYEPRNWEKGMSWSRVFSSLQRHLSLWFHGEDLDDESEMNHLAHAACCVLYLLAYECRDHGIDDRPKLLFSELREMRNFSGLKKLIKDMEKN